MPELVDLHLAGDGVATVTLQHGKVNALSVELLDQLAAVADRLARPAAGDERARCVVLTGGPKLFAAGADITEFADAAHSDPSSESFALGDADQVRRIGGAFLRAVNAVEALPMPTVASISGFALGGGLELALACDFRVASSRAKLALPEILLGIIPGGGGTQRLARLVGPGVAKDMIFTGRQVAAEEALRVGLVHEVVEPDALDERVSAFAAQLAAGPPRSLAAAKQAIDRGIDGPLDAGLALEQDLFVGTFATPDAAVGVRSFLSAGPGHADFRGV